MDLLLRSCAAWLLLVVAANAVFVEKREASAVLTRGRRANSNLEEFKQGNLERECVEEICDYEEAREVFEDDIKTRDYWETYNHRGSCLPNPCRNNGSCDRMGEMYQCLCPIGFAGENCETAAEAFLRCEYHNGQCHHFCSSARSARECYCAEGYSLAPDRQSCIAQVPYPCGIWAPEVLDRSGMRSMMPVGFHECPRGRCPWQVLITLRGLSHCGGALIGSDWVITAHHCVQNVSLGDLIVVAGEHDLDMDDGSEQRLPVSSLVSHGGYDPETGGGDVVLLRLQRPVVLGVHAVPVCLPTPELLQQELLRSRYHTVSGWGLRTTGGNQPAPSRAPPPSPRLHMFSVPLIQRAQCSQHSGLNLASSMICAGHAEGDAESCRGNDGSPLITMQGHTHFLTGVAAWGRGCQQPGYYSLYTSMAGFLDWVQNVTKS